MKVYGFSYDGGEWCFFTEEQYRKGVVSERECHGGELPGFTPWTAEVPDEFLIQAAYDYVEANDLQEYETNYQFNDLASHVGHKLECVTYGTDEPVNVAVECMDCGCVIVDYDKEVSNG